MEENKEILEEETVVEVEELKSEAEILQESGYKARSTWQIVAAWIGLGIVIAGVILYYYHIATGGR